MPILCNIDLSIITALTAGELTTGDRCGTFLLLPKTLGK